MGWKRAFEAGFRGDHFCGAGMDYELLVDIISGFDTDDSVIIRKHLSEG